MSKILGGGFMRKETDIPLLGGVLHTRRGLFKFLEGDQLIKPYLPGGRLQGRGQARLQGKEA